ncbi:MAG: glycogen debranching protein GlgX [Chloroflexi bacterium]|nr:glycogen debranching protein GlgX [Chloroflexota bacterium]
MTEHSSYTQADIQRGESYPLGATVCPDGVNFCVYSKDCTALDLLFFDQPDDHIPSRVIALEPEVNRTLHYWHVFVRGVQPGQIYGFRADGPFRPDHGLRFDRRKLLLDPYGRGVVLGNRYDRESAVYPGYNAGLAAKSVVIETDSYDWEGDQPLKRPFTQTIIYEMHVAGFTKHPNSGVSEAKRGTYAGLIEKIPYLQSLGITAVELMPVFQFDPQDAPYGLINYWGYSPMSFFAPHLAYSSVPDAQGAVNEFRDMVKALHRAGIEVILDVVYNHTAEGDHKGPTFCFRGFANDVYYILEPDRTYYSNYSGTGNTVKADNAIVRRMIIDSLHYWVDEMHVDGFRFDLASILSRDKNGQPLANPPVLWDIETDPVLVGTKLIAEAWDAAGLYQVGHFIGDHWKEWNGQFRDDVRSFVKGDRGSLSALPARFFASPDIYGHREREPELSINFVACHDGFTLNDLVSYNEKHNDANLEGNRDGHNHNLSWNCGIEGPSDDPEVERLRTRQLKNFFTITLLAAGTPMILMGDEVRRTQRGNNNAYCQDNEISWFDWSLVEAHADLLRFVQTLIKLETFVIVIEGGHDDLSLHDLLRAAQITWHGTHLGDPNWGEDALSVAFTAVSRSGMRRYHFIFNAHWEPQVFEIPAPTVKWAVWRRVIDTDVPSPNDIALWDEAAEVHELFYTAQPRSTVVLKARSVTEVDPTEHDRAAR